MNRGGYRTIRETFDRVFHFLYLTRDPPRDNKRIFSNLAYFIVVEIEFIRDCLYF